MTITSRHGRRVGLALTAACLAAGLAGACVPGARRDPPAGGRFSRLVIATGRDFFDGPDSRTYLHASTNTWEALTALDESLEPVPWLAESWTATAGNTVWSFRLRAGVRFHDGTRLTAADAVRSIRRIWRHPKYDPTAIFRDVVAIEAADDRTVVFRLRTPNLAFANLVASYQTPILAPTTFDEQGRLTTLLATGPYRLARLDRGQSVTVERAEAYWGAPAIYDEVVFRQVPDAHVRAAALKAGEVDAVADVGALLPIQIAELRTTPHVVVATRQVATTHYLFFNCSEPAFSSVETRRHVAAAIDRPTLVASLVGEGGLLARDLYTPLARRWAFGVWQDPTSTTAARPVPPSRPLRIVASAAAVQRWPYLPITQYIQDRLRRIGWASTIRVLEPGAYQEALNRRAFDLVVQPNTLMTGDPDFLFSYYLETTGPQHAGCGHPAMDARIREAREEQDMARRRARYLELAEQVLREVSLVPLYHDLTAYAYRDHVGTFSIDAQFKPLLTRPDAKGSR